MSDSIWISTFIEHCLSSYQTEENLRPDRNLKWEDDGSNLRFPSPVKHSVLINSWDLPKAILTDSDTQIDAILSGESLNEYGRAFPREPLSNDGCRGYLIQLDNFQLVYEYSTAKPNVHLYVERFNIIWKRGKTRSPPRGKMVRKNRSLVLLMQKVYCEIKSRESQGKNRSKEELGSEGSVGDILATQAINGHAYASTQAHFMSQLPSHPSMISESIHDPVHDATSSQNHSRPETPEVSRPNREKSTDTHLLNRPSVTASPGHSRAASSVSTTSSPLPAPREVQKPTNAPRIEPLPAKPDISSTRPAPPTREGSISANTQGNSQEKTIERRDSPYSPDKQLNSQLQASQNVTYRPRNPPVDTSQSMVDPWEGMTEIRSVDVTVPADQGEILGREKSQWYPPLIGQPSVSGHVPPALLNEWNRIILRRSRRTADTRSNSAEDDRTSDYNPRSSGSQGSADRRSNSPEYDRLNDLNTPTAEPPEDDGSSEHDTSSPEREIPEWSQSPDQPPRRGRGALPLPDDSSPPRGQSVSRALERTAPRVTNPTSPDSTNENRPSFEAVQGQVLDNSARSLELARTKPASEVIALTAAHGGRDSDDGGSESDMDEVVPQPQSGSTQQGVSSQLEISSSGPPLPESARQIQVAETPSTVLHKLHAMSSKQGDLELSPTNENANFSSQVDKSSSQSRILNTYASLEGDSREEPSPGSSKSVLENDGRNTTGANVVNTPISGQAPQTQDSTSQSQSGSLLPSSAPKSIESNAPIADSTYPSQSSNAFLSNRELSPSSVLSVVEEQGSPSIQRSAPGSPLMPLKRLASETDADFNTSPSKRSKVDQKPTIIDLENEYDAKLLSRYQECIISARSTEASKAYTNFCRTYPAYVGNFAHFVKLCHKLQAFRALGNLQRSPLWDDFIIKSLEEYGAYAEECMTSGTEQLPYEEFFASSFSRPTYKCRSLTVDGINACAAQFTIIDETPTVTPPDPTTDTKISFTSGIREQLFNFHTHSFAAAQDLESQCTQEDNGIGSQYSIPDSEPIRAAAQEIEQEDTQQSADNDEIMDDAEDIGAAHETASVELGDEESPRVRQALSDDDDETMDDPLGDELAETANIEPAVTREYQSGKPFDAAVEADIEDEDNHDDSNDEHHDGDTLHAQMDEDEVGETEEDEPVPASASADKNAEVEETDDDQSEAPSDTAANTNAEVVEAEEAVEQMVDEVVEEMVEEVVDEAVEVLDGVVEEVIDETASDIDFEEPDPDDTDDPNENWFLSLRNIYPTERVWSDDANTPFKKWARADQNVFSVRNRRGGAHVPTDKQGVIQQMNQTRQ
ncbi:hypothetical protein BJX66DRAFT_14646 [Aspergillus keveii]|uniref:Telomere replication protein EST3 n=1 Tax=Aspergillus keveii TaxID=714993 RepID=A0ABR4GIZ6_9EURO